MLPFNQLVIGIWTNLNLQESSISIVKASKLMLCQINPCTIGLAPPVQCPNPSCSHPHTSRFEKWWHGTNMKKYETKMVPKVLQYPHIHAYSKHRPSTSQLAATPPCICTQPSTFVAPANTRCISTISNAVGELCYRHLMFWDAETSKAPRQKTRIIQNSCWNQGPGGRQLPTWKLGQGSSYKTAP